MNTPFPDQ